MKTKIDNRRRKPFPMSLELLGVLEVRRTEFERKFGRPPRRGEPLFFDPEAEVPRRLASPARCAALANVLTLSGMPEFVVADFVANY
jgi:hypothetical protein